MTYLLKNCTIVIPSSNRSHRIEHEYATIRSIPPSLMSQTKVAVRSHELDDYSRFETLHKNILWEVPNKHKGISNKRRFIIENCPTRYVIMLDDDLKFFHRPNMKKSTLRMLDQVSSIGLFTQWLTHLQQYAHVGLSARQGNNHYTEAIEPNYRMNGAYAYDLKLLLAAKPVLGRLELMEDFDLNLQLLRKGVPNVVMFNYCYNTPPSNTDGGCSLYRTNDLQTKCANKLAELHPSYVKVVEKTVNNWKGDMRTHTDVRINWKQAYLSSQR